MCNCLLSGPEKKRYLQLFLKFVIVSKIVLNLLYARHTLRYGIKYQVLEDTRPVYMEVTTKQRN